MNPPLSEETRLVVQAMMEATWKAIEGYRQTGLPVPIWRDGKVVYLSVDEALAARSDYQQRMAAKGARPQRRARGAGEGRMGNG